MAITAFRYSSLLDPQRFQSLGQATFPPTPIPATPGMVLLTDYTITHAGTSATLTNGQVTFTAVTSLSLNGVFSADFDNYVVSIRHKLALGNDPIQMRLRVSGSDASGTDYTRQRLLASSTTVQALRSTSQTSAAVGYASADYRAGDVAYIYGPFLAQPTAFRNNNAGDISGGSIYEYASTHSVSTSYDGFTLIPASSSLTGALQVYGIRM